MPITARPLALATGALAAVALIAASAAPAQADPVALSAAAAAPVVTLPVGDGYQDVESLVVTASDAATATVTLQRAGGAAAVVGQDLPLQAGANPIAIPTAGLVAGAYTVVVATRGRRDRLRVLRRAGLSRDADEARRPSLDEHRLPREGRVPGFGRLHGHAVDRRPDDREGHRHGEAHPSGAGR